MVVIGKTLLLGMVVARNETVVEHLRGHATTTAKVNHVAIYTSWMSIIGFELQLHSLLYLISNF